MNYGSLFHKSVKVLMILGLSTQILGSSLIHVPLVFADGNNSISITRNDTITSNYPIGPNSSMTGMSFGFTTNTNVVGSGINVIVSDGAGLSCNLNTFANVFSEVRLYYSGSLVAASSNASEQYLTGANMTGCAYQFPFDLQLGTGTNSFDLQFSTVAGSFTDVNKNIRFIVNEDSFPYLTSGSGDIIMSSNFNATSSESATFTTTNAGINTISKTYVANPQIAIRETQFTAIKFSIGANASKNLVLSGFSVNMSGYDNAVGGIYNATLFVDESNDPIATGLFSNGTGVTFSGLNEIITASSYKDFWIKVMSTASVPTTGLAPSYDLQFSAGDFVLHDSDGYVVNVSSQYDSIMGNMIDVKDGIEVFAHRTSATSTAIIPADTQTGITIGTFELQPDYLPVLIEELTLVNVDDTFYNTSLNSDTVSGHINTSTDGAIVELYQGMTKVGEAQLLNGIAYIDLVSPITVLPGVPVSLTVKIKSNTIITSVGDTNKSIRLGLLDPGELDMGTVQTLITVPNTSIEVTGGFTSLLFNKQLLRATTLTFADQLISDTSSNNLLSVAGQNEAVLFKTILTANSSHSATLNQIKFQHASNGVVASNFKLKVDGTVLSADDANCVLATGNVICAFTTSGVYTNGLTINTDNRIISLVADVTPSIAGNDYITTSLDEGAPSDYSMNTVAGVNPAATVIWSDNAEPNVTPASANWFTDAGIEKLPSNAWTFTRVGEEGGTCINGATNYPICDNNVAATNMTITRTDSFFSNRNVPVNTTGILGMSFDLNLNEARNLSSLNVFVTDNSTGACTNDTNVHNVITKASLYMSGILVSEDVSSDGCIYQFSLGSDLKQGSNLFDIRFDTHSGAMDGIPVRFTVDSSSIGTLSTGSTTIINPTINGSATSIYSIISRPGVESIAKTYVANPQIAIRGNDMTAIKFAITASNVSDLVVRGFDTTMTLGSNMSGGLQDAFLYVQGTTGIVDADSFSGANTISFSGLNITIPAANSKEFWVLIDTTMALEASGVSNLQFVATNFAIEDIAGNPVPFSASVSGNMIDVKDGIEVFAHRTSATSTAIIPADTQTGITIGTFELQPDYGSVLVEELTFVNLANSFTGTAINSNTVSGHINTSTDGVIVELYQGMTKVGEAQLLNGIAYIDLVNPITVLPGAPVSFTVKIKSNAAITSVGDTNKSIRLGLLDPGELGIGTAQTLISPVNGSYAIVGSFTHLIFNAQLLRATSLTFTDQLNPTQGQANNIFAIEAMNERTVFRTLATAHSSKSALIKQLIFNHTTGGLVSTENFKLKVDGVVLSTGDATCAFASNKVACIFGSAYVNGLTVAAGSGRMIELVADVGVSLQDGDYITTSLDEGAPSDYSMNTVAGVNPAATVIWSDNAESNVTPASANWFTDAGIEQLPSNTWTFVRSDEGGTCINGATNYPNCNNNIRLTVTKSSDSPVSKTIYSNSSNIEALKLDVYASGGDITVTGLVVRLSGLVDSGHVVIGASSGAIVLDTGAVDSDFTTSLVFEHPLLITENTTGSLTIFVNTVNSINERFVVSVESYNSVKANSLISGGFPITSSEITTSNSGSLFCTTTNISQSQCDALMALYNSTNGSGWLHNTGWGVDTNVENWYGVDISGGNVVNIFLGSNNLSGPIPAEIGNLVYLQQLLLNDNYFSGMIPDSIQYLTDLNVFAVTNNQLTADQSNNAILSPVVRNGFNTRNVEYYIGSNLYQPLLTGSKTCDYYIAEGNGFGGYLQSINYLKELRLADGSTLPIGLGFGSGQGQSPYGYALISWGSFFDLHFTGGVDLDPNMVDDPTYVYVRTNALLSGVVGVKQSPDYCIDGSGNMVGSPGQSCPMMACSGGSCENPLHMVSGAITQEYYPFIQSGCTTNVSTSIQGKAWFENTYDGLHDSITENTVDGANVYLYECNTGNNGSHYVSSLEELMAQFAAQGNTATNNLLATGITDYYGGYQFSGLEAGKFYNVRFGGIPGFEPAGNKFGHNNRTCVQAGTTGLDFTLLTKAIVGGQTWFDANKDGIRQSGENTVDGMNMYLVQCIDDIPVKTIATGITDYYGGYQFTVPTAGNYIVTAGSISGYSLPDSTLTDSCRSILTQSNSWNYDLGLIPAQAMITGQTWFDTTSNGLYQSGLENTVDGMNVYLYACNKLTPSSRLIASTTTDYYGGYQFSGVGAGFYQIRFGGIPGFALSNEDSPCIALGHNDSYQFDSYLTEYTLGDPEFTSALQWMYASGLTQYNTESAYQPMSSITNEEAAQMINMFASGVLHMPNINNLCNFDNLSGAQIQYRKHITEVCQKGLTRHIYGSFASTGLYTKADLVTILSKGLGGYQEDRLATPRYQNYCTYAQQYGITREINCSDLNRPITKYEIALMLYRSREAVSSVRSNMFQGTAFFDENSDFNYQSGENTVDGMNVYLMRCDSDVALMATTTDYYGGYQFSGLLDGSYKVKIGGISGFETYKGFDEQTPCFLFNQYQTGNTRDIPLISNYPKVGGYQTGLHLWNQGSYVVTHDFTIQNSGSLMNQLKSIGIGANRIVGDSWFTLSEMIDSIRITNKTNGSVSYLSGFTSSYPMMWTPWIDRDDPGGDGDAEYYDTLFPDDTLNIWGACDGKESIVQIVTTDTNQTPEQVGQIVRYSQSNRGRGYQCLNSQNPGGCRDYQVRFLCNNDLLSKDLSLALTGGKNSIEVAVKFNNGYPQSTTPYDMTLDISHLGYGSSQTGVFDVIDNYLIPYNSMSLPNIDPYRESTYDMISSDVIGYQLKYIASGTQSRVAGQTRFDINGDGVKQSTELTVDKMNMGLYHCIMSGSQIIATNYMVSQTTTDYYGGYQFAGLIPGWYQVRVGGIQGYQNPIKQSQCLYVDATTSKNFDSYLMVAPVVQQGGGGGGGGAGSAGSASSSSSSNSMINNSIDVFPEVKTTTNIKNTIKSNQTKETSTVSQTTPITKVSTISTQSSETTTTPKQIVTVKINNDGTLEIVRDSSVKKNIVSEGEPRSYFAKDILIQQQVDNSSSSQQVTPIMMKPYWVITPEMLQDISILQNGYQPTWDAVPYAVSIRFSSSDAWDASPSESITSGFYKKLRSVISFVR